MARKALVRDWPMGINVKWTGSKRTRGQLGTKSVACVDGRRMRRLKSVLEHQGQAHQEFKNKTWGFNQKEQKLGGKQQCEQKQRESERPRQSGMAGRAEGPRTHGHTRLLFACKMWEDSMRQHHKQNKTRKEMII